MSDIGLRLREWRTTRRLSQLELSVRAGVSARHLSFLETGRSRPTREMILRLADRLAVPLRSQNELLLAGGFAPAHPESDLNGAPLAAVLSSLRDVLAGHEPYPAVLVDRHWTMVDANRAVARLTAGCADRLLEPPVNVLRLSLHPDGMAPRIGNLAQWRTHVLGRLDQQAVATADPVLRSLHDELAALPGGELSAPSAGELTDPSTGELIAPSAGELIAPSTGTNPEMSANLVVPLRFDDLTFFSVTSVLGTPRDVTLQELAIESFLPADAATAAALK